MALSPDLIATNQYVCIHCMFITALHKIFTRREEHSYHQLLLPKLYVIVHSIRCILGFEPMDLLDSTTELLAAECIGYR